MRLFALASAVTLVACANGIAGSGDDTSRGPKPVSTDGGAPLADASAEVDAGDCRAALAKPWDGAGVTTGFMNGSVLTLVSGDRYWTFDYATGAWQASGHLQAAWAGVPTVDGKLPWEDTGVHAAWVVGSTLTIVSGDRMWTRDMASGSWGATSHLETTWASAPANGGFEPWDAPSVQTAYPYQSGLTVVSGDREWVLDLGASTWTTGTLETKWAAAPKVDSDLPWQASGVSASWVYDDVQTILSGDRYWIVSATNGTWSDTGHLETVWANAPAVDDCK